MMIMTLIAMMITMIATITLILILPGLSEGAERGGGRLVKRGVCTHISAMLI